MGSSPTIYNEGKIFTVPLVDSNSDSVLFEAFSVNNILVEKVGREEIILNEEDFPHLSKAVLDEAAKPLHKKFLDILIGHTYVMV